MSKQTRKNGEIDEHGRKWAQFPSDDVDDCNAEEDAVKSYRIRVACNMMREGTSIDDLPDADKQLVAAAMMDGTI
tara:strand:- start:2197 stop:2421 length:225 start_codon:yes stop_codon:yes gene_type:complete